MEIDVNKTQAVKIITIRSKNDESALAGNDIEFHYLQKGWKVLEPLRLSNGWFQSVLYWPQPIELQDGVGRNHCCSCFFYTSEWDLSNQEDDGADQFSGLCDLHDKWVDFDDTCEDHKLRENHKTLKPTNRED